MNFYDLKNSYDLPDGVYSCPTEDCITRIKDKSLRVLANRRGKPFWRTPSERLERFDVKENNLASEELITKLGLRWSWCLLCGKPLSDPYSLKHGMGRQCRERLNFAKSVALG